MKLDPGEALVLVVKRRSDQHSYGVTVRKVSYTTNELGDVMLGPLQESLLENPVSGDLAIDLKSASKIFDTLRYGPETESLEARTVAFLMRKLDDLDDLIDETKSRQVESEGSVDTNLVGEAEFYQQKAREYLSKREFESCHYGIVYAETCLAIRDREVSQSQTMREKLRSRLQLLAEAPPSPLP